MDNTQHYLTWKSLNIILHGQHSTLSFMDNTQFYLTQTTIKIIEPCKPKSESDQGLILFPIWGLLISQPTGNNLSRQYFFLPKFVIFVLFDLILYVPSTILKLCRDRSSWVEPVSSQALYHWATALPYCQCKKIFLVIDHSQNNWRLIPVIIILHIKSSKMQFTETLYDNRIFSEMFFIMEKPLYDIHILDQILYTCMCTIS